MKYLIMVLIGLSSGAVRASDGLCQSGLGGPQPFPQWLIRACASGKTPQVGRVTAQCQLTDGSNRTLILSSMSLPSENVLVPFTHLLQIFSNGEPVVSEPVREILGILDTFYENPDGTKMTLEIGGGGVVRSSGIFSKLDCGF